MIDEKGNEEPRKTTYEKLQNADFKFYYYEYYSTNAELELIRLALETGP